MRNPLSDMLLELIATEGITQRTLAWKIDMRSSQLNEIISGKQFMTPEKAFRVEKEFPSFKSCQALGSQVYAMYHHHINRHNWKMP